MSHSIKRTPMDCFGGSYSVHRRICRRALRRAHTALLASRDIVDSIDLPLITGKDGALPHAPRAAWIQAPVPAKYLRK